MTYPTGGTPEYPAAPGYNAPVAAAPQMDFATAVRSVLTQYANFQGRARRSEFWWFVLAWALAYVVAAVVDGILDAPILTILFLLGTIVPYLAVSVRRLHDTGRSGWWLLLGLIPFGGIVVLVFQCLDSEQAPNTHGPSPKYQAAGAL